MNFQPAGKVCLFSMTAPKKAAKIHRIADPFETQQAIESALAIPGGLP
jgi:hypothetical protein